MKPTWTRRGTSDTWKLKGAWLRLLEGSDKKIQVLTLRQLCKMTFWLAVIGISQVLLTCEVLFYQ